MNRRKLALTCLLAAALSSTLFGCGSGGTTTSTRSEALEIFHDAGTIIGCRNGHRANIPVQVIGSGVKDPAGPRTFAPTNAECKTSTLLHHRSAARP
jgi:hypothetical protein